MRTVHLAILTLALTFVLLLLGGLVHATGSSLACPDWPLCYGEAFPKMEGGILFEHSHRLVASTVGIFTLVLAVLLLRRWRGSAKHFGLGAFTLVLSALGMALDVAQGVAIGSTGVSTEKPLFLIKTAAFISILVFALLIYLARLSRDRVPVVGLLAFHVVTLQALLGGLTVVFRLPTAVSTAHLATSFAFFCILTFLALRLRFGTAPKSAPIVPRSFLATAIMGVFLQSILGALVRHTGSGMACGVTLLSCNGMMAPPNGPAHLHFTHRILAIVVAGFAIAATIKPLKAARKEGRVLARLFGVFAHILVLVQILLGALTVTSVIAVPIVTAHLGVAALLLADLVALFVALGPLGTPRSAALSSDLVVETLPRALA